jgi:signal transduction histidine kinase
MEDNQLSFTIKSGLKNIIGRDLITDDYVAVFELVKNSFDAYAKKVLITFKKDKIIITDDGKGMDLDDIKKKWLAVAYSAKKEGVEDEELVEKEFDSYRSKIQAKKFFAGAKGIGRFSCDRLGNELVLTSKKASSNAKIEQIVVNWSDFEKDSKDEFIDIKVKHRTLQPVTKALKKLQYGTILEISKLNSTWDRQKKLNLKYSLEKLINPFEDNPLNDFSIFIEDEDEVKNDSPNKNKRTDVNGEVKNFVFETLGLKTTQILTEIPANGEYIITSLIDRGTVIYRIRKTNNTIPKLENIKIHLFHLNRAGKNSFTRLMGIEPINFGSIFLYKNGFRIPPYGDWGFDYFGLDSRKTQRHFNRFGSRDLIGRIEIIGNNPNFKEISSRDGGLVRNEHYQALVKLLINSTLLKLENYANDVLFTNKEDKNRDDLSALNNITAKSALINLISDEIDDDQIELLDTDKENLKLRTEELLQTASEKDIHALKNIAKKLGDKSFKVEAEKTSKEYQQVLELQKKLAEEESERKKADEDKKKLEEQLAIEKEKNTYLRTSSRSLSEDAKGLVHNIKITSKRITSNVDTLYDKILNGKIKQEEILSRLGVIKFNAEKALKISMLITRSNFRTYQNEQEVDLVRYINQYIEIYSEIYEKDTLKFELENHNAEFIRRISVLDISLILDDLISNSEKAEAKKILLDLSNPTKNSLKLLFSDNGKGVQKKFLNYPEQLFELGVTTTDGSGIGLNSIRKALKTMKGEISFIGNGQKLKGACFEILFE